MKIRITTNQIRFRISETDVNNIQNGQTITTQLELANNKLCFAIATDKNLKQEHNIQFNNGEVKCTLHPFLLEELQETNNLKFTQEATSYIIEMDLQKKY